jgi:hypothetical protein
MRFNSRQAALMGIPDLPMGAFEHVGDRRIRPQGGGGIPIVSDVVDFVGDVVGGVVDGVVGIITDIPLIGEFADDQLGLDPGGGGMVPVIKGIATAAVLAPVGGFVGGALNTGLGLGLGTAGTAALGGATIGATTGGLKGAVYGAAGGYLGSVVSQSIVGDTTVQVFDDGSTLTYNSATGLPISGADINGNTFSVGGDGIARYADGSTLGGIPEQNFGSSVSVADYVPPPPQPPEWVQQGFTSELEARNFTNEDIFRLENQGVARQDISEFARKGFTSDDVRMFANQGMSIEDVAQYTDQFGPDAVRQLRAMDYTLDDIAMLQGMGLNNDQIVNLANNAVNEQSIAYWASQGYNPDAVIDAMLANDGQASMNALISAGPEASYSVPVAPTPVVPEAPVNIDQIPPLTEPPGTPSIIQERAWNPVSSGSAGTELGSIVELPNGQQVWVSDDGTLAYAKNTNNIGWDRTPTTLDDLINPQPTPVPPPAEIFPELPPLQEPPGTPVDTGAPVYEPSLPEPYVPPPESYVPPPAEIFPELPPLQEPPGTPIDTGVPVYEPALPEPPPFYDTPPVEVFPELPPLQEPPGTPVDTGAPVYEPSLPEPPVVETPVPPTAIEDLPPLTEPPGTPPDLNAPVYEPSLPEPPVDGAPVVDITDINGNPGTRPYDEGALGPLNPNAGDLQVTVPGFGDINIPPEIAIPGAIIGGGAVVDALTPEMPTARSPYEGQTFVSRPPDQRFTGDLIRPNMVPAYVGRAAQVPFYQTTSPVQSQFYWGNRPYVPLNGDMTQYNQVPEAPVVPWGLRQAFFEQPITGPVAPVIYGPNMTPIRRG